MRDFLRPSWYGAGNRNSNVVSQSPPGDLPPKYEELGSRGYNKFTQSNDLMMMILLLLFISDLPPQYDESMSANLPDQCSSSADNQGSDGANQESPTTANTRSQDH